MSLSLKIHFGNAARFFLWRSVNYTENNKYFTCFDPLTFLMSSWNRHIDIQPSSLYNFFAVSLSILAEEVTKLNGSNLSQINTSSCYLHRSAFIVFHKNFDSILSNFGFNSFRKCKLLIHKNNSKNSDKTNNIHCLQIVILMG